MTYINNEVLLFATPRKASLVYQAPGQSWINTSFGTEEGSTSYYFTVIHH